MGECKRLTAKSKLAAIEAALSVHSLRVAIPTINARLALQILAAANDPARPDLWAGFANDPEAATEDDLSAMIEHEPPAVREFWGNLTMDDLQRIAGGRGPC